MMTDTIAVLTGKSAATLLAEGGSSSWVLNTRNAQRQRYLVCVRNGSDRRDRGSTEPHGTAFLVALIQRLEHAETKGDIQRWRIVISDYAVIARPEAWKGWRNPVRYTSLEELGIDADGLSFAPVPPTEAGTTVDGSSPAQVRPLTIPEAKAGLALALAISPEAIEIIIKG